MNKDINYFLIDSDFEILDIIDCLTKHHDKDDHLQWGLESHLKMDLSPYYYFSINTQNLSKKVIPGKAYVNGIETEYVKGLSRGEYLIKKELVKEPLEIRIESIPAYLVHVEQFKYCDVLALEKEKVSLSILDYKFNEFCINGYKPHFTFYKAGTKEEIKLDKLEYFLNNIHPWLTFIMPVCDIDVVIEKVEDNLKEYLSIDESNIKDIEYSSFKNYNIYFSGIVSEALYSDDYDLGIEDHYFYEKRILFKKGRNLKVIVYLLEKRDIICSLNNVDYLPSKYEEIDVKGDDRVQRHIYSYLFQPVKFKKEGTLSFKIKEE